MSTIWFIVAIGVPFIWGIQAVMLKFGIGQFPPIFMVSLRFLFMFILLMPFLSRLKGQFRLAATVGFTQGVAHFALLYIGFKYADVTSGMIVYQTNAIFTLLLGSILLGEKMTKYAMSGTAICLIGVSLILGMPQENTNITGLFIIACSALMFALGNICVRKFGPFDPVGLNATVSLIAFPALLFISFLTEKGQLESLRTASLEAWGALFYTAIFGGVLAFILWYKLLIKFSVDQISPFSLLMPFFAMMGSIIILDEKVTIVNWIGAVITIGGIAIIQYSNKLVTLKGRRSVIVTDQ
ncbi:DMT family transporter [Serratia sp. DD3]|uniref:DMT family transporter n=1 Tax=Serratia sp. DD3 TaxID=1410619 RepID=UPI0004D7B58A|nr:EamA family transporter [Serratia sp. DD3]KEY56998.1 putative amino-acid metabolite efflux pump [Serratia sp. DD3]